MENLNQFQESSGVVEDQNTENAEPLRYDVKPEIPFTLDEQQEITEFRQGLENSINSKKAIVKGLESLFLNLSVFAIARWVVLTTGQSGVNLAIVLILLANQVVNRDALTGFNVNRTDSQWEFLNVERIFKVLGGLVIFGFTAYLNLGSFISEFKSSEEAFHAVENRIEEFNNLNRKEQSNEILSLLLIVGATATVIGLYERSRNKA